MLASGVGISLHWMVYYNSAAVGMASKSTPRGSTFRKKTSLILQKTQNSITKATLGLRSLPLKPLTYLECSSWNAFQWPFIGKDGCDMVLIRSCVNILDTNPTIQ